MSLSRIVIFGVTGNQGASVARALLEDTTRKFEVWGVTRNPASRSSQAMEKLGVKLVKGDLDDPTTYEESLKDADGVFLNANFWAHYKGNNSEEAKEAEVRQSSSAVDACKRAGVKHIVYSTLESYQPRQELPHFDAKAEVTKHMKKLGVPGTQLYTSYYFSNLLVAKLEEQDGATVLKLPLPDDTVIPGFNSDQIGLWARVAFRDPEEWIGKDLIACSDNISVANIVRTLSELSGKKYKTTGTTKEQFMALKGNMDEELWLNYLAFVNGEMKRDPVASRKLVPEAQDFKAWAQTPAAAEKFGSKSA